MPTRHVSAETMSVGKKGGGKHWTAAQVEARKAADQGVSRKVRVYMQVPKWLNDEARAVWEQTRNQVRGLELLDNLDAQMLAVYADAVARYQTMSKLQLDSDGIKELQAWARLIAQYADKLGLSPAARARLVKKKADEMLDGFGNEFD